MGSPGGAGGGGAASPAIPPGRCPRSLCWPAGHSPLPSELPPPPGEVPCCPFLQPVAPPPPLRSHTQTGTNTSISIFFKASCLEAIMKILLHAPNPRTPHPGENEVDGPGPHSLLL